MYILGCGRKPFTPVAIPELAVRFLKHARECT